MGISSVPAVGAAPSFRSNGPEPGARQASAPARGVSPAGKGAPSAAPWAEASAAAASAGVLQEVLRRPLLLPLAAVAFGATVAAGTPSAARGSASADAPAAAPGCLSGFFSPPATSWFSFASAPPECLLSGLRLLPVSVIAVPLFGLIILYVRHRKSASRALVLGNDSAGGALEKNLAEKTPCCTHVMRRGGHSIPWQTKKGQCCN